jgi:hypothetical protein
MIFRKGNKIEFKSRTELITKGSSDRINGMVTTENQTYSVDYLCRQIEFGFIKLLKK